MRAALALLLIAGIAVACARMPGLGPSGAGGPRPPEPALYASLPAGHTGYANASLAELFVSLTHETEWGGVRPNLVRLEEPVIVGLEGRGAERYAEFLEAYLAYLRRHTDLEIRTGGPGRALHLRLIEGRAFTRLLPTASCVLVPGDIAWDDFAAAPDRRGGLAMVSAVRLAAVTVFIPDTAIPADIRRCILEEVAQALGPVNDLYGLGPSIFNDDFGHLWPTRLDLLMLRVLYDPEMETGLGRTETRRRARRVLDRINPAGLRAPPLPGPETGAAGPWARLITEAHSTSAGRRAQRRAAEAALEQARIALPETAWHCQSLETLAHLSRIEAPERAVALLVQAEAVCAAVHGADDPRLPRIRLGRAALALAAAEPERALALSDGLEADLAAHGLDEALAAQYALRVRALEALGRDREAAEVRRLAEAWGAYALGRPLGRRR